MKPRCYNRPPFGPGRWCQDGSKRGRPVYRWVPFRMSPGCMSHAGPAGVVDPGSVPQREGWNCSGCKHDPREGV